MQLTIFIRKSYSVLAILQLPNNFYVPSRLQQIAEASGGRIVIGRVGTQVKSEPVPNKGFKM